MHTDTCNNINEIQNKQIERSQTKCRLYESICLKKNCRKYTLIYSDGKQMNGCLDMGMEALRESWITKGHEQNLGVVICDLVW